MRKRDSGAVAGCMLLYQALPAQNIQRIRLPANNTCQQTLMKRRYTESDVPLIYQKSRANTCSVTKNINKNSSQRNTLADQIDEFNNIDKIYSLSDTKLNFETKNLRRVGLDQSI